MKKQKIEGGEPVDFFVDVLISCCEINYSEGKPIITYSGKKIDEAVKVFREDCIKNLFREGYITFWGKDFDGVETIGITIKGDVAKYYYDELSKIKLTK